MSGRARGPSYRTGEDKALCKAWIEVSTEGGTGTNQSSDEFYASVKAVFDELILERKQWVQDRSPISLKTRGCLEVRWMSWRVTALAQSGRSVSDMEHQAIELFESIPNNDRFRFLQCWNILKTLTSGALGVLPLKTETLRPSRSEEASSDDVVTETKSQTHDEREPGEGAGYVRPVGQQKAKLERANHALYARQVQATERVKESLLLTRLTLQVQGTNSWLDAGITDDRRPRTFVALAQYLREHSVADSTFTKYSAAMTKWTVWTSRRGIEPWLSGLTDEDRIQVLSEFIVHGFQYGFGAGSPLRGSSIVNTLQGVRYFFSAVGRVLPLSHPHVRMLLKGICRLDTPPWHKALVSIRFLETCFHTLRFDDPFAQALWGVVCVAFFFLLRRSEIVSISGNAFKWFALRAEDLVVLDTTGAPTLSAIEARSVHMSPRPISVGMQQLECCIDQGTHSCALSSALFFFYGQDKTFLSGYQRQCTWSAPASRRVFQQHICPVRSRRPLYRMVRIPRTSARTPFVPGVQLTCIEQEWVP